MLLELSKFLRTYHITIDERAFLNSLVNRHVLNDSQKRMVNKIMNQYLGNPRKKGVLDNNMILLSFSMTNLESANVNKIPGRIWNGKIKRWSIPLNEYSMSKIKEWGWSVDRNVEEWYETFKENNSEIDLSLPNGLSYKPFQEEGIKLIDTLNGRALLADEMGLGKAQAISEPILTPVGWTTIGKIKVGDKVIGSNGQPITVIGVFPQGIKDSYKVTFTDKVKVRCDLEHLWTVIDQTRKTRGQDWYTITLEEIMKRGHKYKTGANKFEIPHLSSPVQFDSDPVYNPYLIGALIANGGCNNGSIDMTVNEYDLDVKEKVNKDVTINKWNKRSGCFRSIILNHTKIIKDLKLNVKSKDKFIPESYLRAPINQRIELLKGLMDGDGSNNKNKITYHTISKQLAEDISELTRSLAGVAVIREYDRTKENKPIEYQVNIKTNFCPFFSKRKSKGWREDFKPIGNKIESIKKVGKEESVCIMVDSSDHLYVTTGYKLTHNTVQAIGYLKLYPQDRPALLIVPASLKINWQQEISKWAPNEEVTIISGRNSSVKHNSNIIIINYDIINDYIDVIETIKPRIMILDESHYIKNVSAMRTRSIRYLGKKMEKIICISGTPITNRPSEFFTTLNLLNPNMFPSQSTFEYEYCDKDNDPQAKGAINTERLNDILNKSFMIRRKKADVLTELPDKMKTSVVFPLDNWDDYNFAKRDLVSYLRETEGNAAAMKARSAMALVRFEKMKQLAVEGKQKYTFEWIDNHISEGKLVVFCTHKKTINDLMERYGDIAVKIDGSVPTKKRQEVVDKFQNDPKIKLFVGNVRAAGVGITLTAASNIAFIELPWTPGECVQAEDRCHRIGQLNPVNVYYLVAANTIEEEIAEIIDRKARVLDAVIDGEVTDEENLLMSLIDKYKDLAI